MTRAWSVRNSGEGRHKNGGNLNLPATEESELPAFKAELETTWETTLEHNAGNRGRAMLENGQ